MFDLDIEIQLNADANEVLFNLRLFHHVNKEIAHFLFGRRGAGHVDPMILDNIDYRKMIDDNINNIRVPRYRYFEEGDRRGRIHIITSFGEVSGFSRKRISWIKKRLLEI